MARTALACLVATLGVGVVAAAPAAAQAAPSPATASKPEKTREKGYAVSCAGQSGDVSVVVDLYQNSAFGSHAGLSVQTPDGEYGGGFGPEDAPLFARGRIAADIPLRRLDDTGEPAGAASVTGTYRAVGAPKPVHEVIEDPADHYVISVGTNRQLSTAVRVEVLGETVPLSCSTAFAFDLTVWRFGAGGD